MTKKILAICAALVAFAAVPAVASAAPHLTTNTGTAAGVGDTITATNTSSILFTSNLGTVTCTSSNLHGTVATNTGKNIEGTISSASFTGGGTGGACTSWLGNVTVTPENLHWCIKSSVLGSFTLRAGGCAEAQKNLKFTLHFPSFSCTFERTSSVSGTYKSNENDVGLLLTGEPEFVRTVGGFGCPSSGKLHAAYKLTGYKIT